VLYVLELALIILCFLFSAPASLQTFASKVFVVTVVINLAVLLLRDKMRGKNGWLYGLVIAGVGLIVMLALIGLADLLGLGVSSKIIGWFKPVNDLAQTVKTWLKPVRDVLARLF
jgi:hypothetical protein